MESIDIVSSEAGQPPKLILKLVSAGVAFFVAGINDGSLGPLIPHIRESYGIKEDKIAIVYVNPTPPPTDNDRY